MQHSGFSEADINGVSRFFVSTEGDAGLSERSGSLRQLQAGWGTAQTVGRSCCDRVQLFAGILRWNPAITTTSDLSMQLPHGPGGSLGPYHG
jgi:hypothetical protein